MNKNYWTTALIIYLLIYGVACLLIGIYTNFYVSVNDFWGNLYMAEHLDINKLESFYNGFYPLGFPVYLRIFSFSNPIIFAYVTNIFFGLLMLGSIGYLCRVTVGPKWALISTIILSIIPRIFSYITLPGPDMGGTAFITLGSVLLIFSIQKPDDKKSKRLIILGGFLLGLSALWRYHFLILAFAFVLSLSLISKKPFKFFVLASISLFSVYGIQILFNIFSNHNAFETSSSFNVFKTIYGDDWQHITEIKGGIPKSMLDVIFLAPKDFLIDYISDMQEFLLLFLPFILSIFLLKDKKFVRISISFALALFLYVLVVTMGISERAVIPMLPFVVYQTIVLLKFIYESVREKLDNQKMEILTIMPVFIIIAGLFFGLMLMDNKYMIDWRKTQSEDYISVEKILIKEGGIKDARQVFANDLDIYFPDMKSFHPYTNGDWERYDLFGYDEEFPELSTENIDEFLNDCYTHNIKYLVFDSKYEVYFEELDQIYTEELEVEQIKKIAEVDNLKIFKLGFDGVPGSR